MSLLSKRLIVSAFCAGLAILIPTAQTLASDRMGIGVLLTERSQLIDETAAENIVIRGTVPGQPAAAAGVMAGDFLLSVNGQSVQRLTMEETVELIGTASRSTVELTLLRDGQRLNVSLVPVPIGEPDNLELFSDSQGQSFTSMWIPTTRYTGPCPGTGFSPTFNGISALASIPPAADRRIIITNQRTGGYTDRAYDSNRARSESFDIAFGTAHSNRYFTVLPGQNVLTYQIMDGEAVVGSASFLLSVEQRFNDVYRPTTLVAGQPVCPAANSHIVPTPYPNPYISPVPHPYIPPVPPHLIPYTVPQVQHY